MIICFIKIKHQTWLRFTCRILDGFKVLRICVRIKYSVTQTLLFEIKMSLYKKSNVIYLCFIFDKSVRWHPGNLEIKQTPIELFTLCKKIRGDLFSKCVFLLFQFILRNKRVTLHDTCTFADGGKVGLPLFRPTWRYGYGKSTLTRIVIEILNIVAITDLCT